MQTVFTSYKNILFLRKWQIFKRDPLFAPLAPNLLRLCEKYQIKCMKKFCTFKKPYYCLNLTSHLANLVPLDPLTTEQPPALFPGHATDARNVEKTWKSATSPPHEHSFTLFRNHLWSCASTRSTLRTHAALRGCVPHASRFRAVRMRSTPQRKWLEVSA